MKLEIKVLLLVITILLVLSGISTAVLVFYQRQHALSQFQETAGAITAALQGSLEQCMLTGDRTLVQKALVSTADNNFITEASVFNPGKVIAASSRLAGIGETIDDSSLSNALQSGDSSVTFVTRQGNNVLQSFIPVFNRPACQSCHPSEKSVLGAIGVTLDTATVTEHLRVETLLSVVLGSVTFFFVVGSLAVMLKRTVLNPLGGLARAAQKVSQGQYSARTAAASSDEIGVLAKAFNEMAESVEQHNLELQRSHQRLVESNANLESRVESRTKELSNLNAVREQLLEKLISAQEEERRRIARELHDEASQSLAALAVNLEEITEVLPDELQETRQRLEVLKDRVVGTLSGIRGLALELRPSALDDLGLLPAIDWYAKDLMKKRGLDTQVSIIGQKTKLPAYTETMLFRIVQESLTNIVRHAEATRVSVELKFSPAEVVLRVEDNGKGFAVSEALVQEGLRQNLGIHGMMERAALLGGTLEVRSQQGQGTVVLVTLPVGRENGIRTDD